MKSWLLTRLRISLKSKPEISETNFPLLPFSPSKTLPRREQDCACKQCAVLIVLCSSSLSLCSRSVFISRLIRQFVCLLACDLPTLPYIQHTAYTTHLYTALHICEAALCSIHAHAQFCRRFFDSTDPLSNGSSHPQSEKGQHTMRTV